MSEKTGIHLAAYCAYEQEDRIMPYPLDNPGEITELGGVKITGLLDNYNLFYISPMPILTILTNCVDKNG